MRTSAREEQFRRLYQHWGRQLLAYAVRRTVCREDAADVVAETFAIAWRRFDVVPEGDGALPWLYATARRVAANFRRAARTRSCLVERAGTEQRPGFPGGDDVVDDALLAAAALSCLDEEDREVLMLVAWEGLGTSQLASALGCSTGAARVRLHRARKRLRAGLSEPETASRPTAPRLPMHPFPEEVNDDGRSAPAAQP